MKDNSRYEIKFVSNNIGLSNFISWLYNYTTLKKKYSKRKVNSLYLDDIFYTSAKDNLIGLPNRKKIRFRWYNKIKNMENIFFEIKKRTNRLTFKTICKLNFANKQLTINNLINESLKELKLNKILIDKHLMPTLLTTYDREYYEDENGIRLTIDSDIIFSRPMLFNEPKNNFSYKYNSKIIEIKFDPSLKDKVSILLKKIHPIPQRHSKYLVGLAKLGDLTYL